MLRLSRTARCSRPWPREGLVRLAVTLPALALVALGSSAAAADCTHCELLYALQGPSPPGSVWTLDPGSGQATQIAVLPSSSFWSDLAVTPLGRILVGSPIISGTPFGVRLVEIDSCNFSQSFLDFTPVGFPSGNYPGITGALDGEFLYAAGPPLIRLDPATQVATAVGGVIGSNPGDWCGVIWGDLAFNPLDGQLYGVVTGAACLCTGTVKLVRFDPATGRVDAEIGCVTDGVGGNFPSLWGLGFDSQGRLWGVNESRGNVVEIDPATALVVDTIPLSGGYNRGWGAAMVPTVARAGPDTLVCMGEVIQLDASASITNCPAGELYEWREGATVQQPASVLPTWAPDTSTLGTRTYTLVVSCPGIPSCEAQDDIAVTVRDCSFAVSWGDFSATPHNGPGAGIDIEWSTLAERGTLYFEIERAAAAAGPYVPTGLVAEARGALARYRLHDAAPGWTRVWYRVVEYTDAGRGDVTPPFAVEAGRGGRARAARAGELAR